MSFDNAHFVALCSNPSGFEVKGGELPAYLNPDLVRRYVRAVALWGDIIIDGDGYIWSILDFDGRGPSWKLADNRHSGGEGALTFMHSGFRVLLAPKFTNLQNGLIVMVDDVATDELPAMILGFIANFERVAQSKGMSDTITPLSKWDE